MFPMNSEPSAYGKYVKLFNSGTFSGIVESVDTDATTVNIRTAKGELLSVGRSDIAELSPEEEKEFLRTFKKEPSQADAGAKAA